MACGAVAAAIYYNFTLFPVRLCLRTWLDRSPVTTHSTEGFRALGRLLTVASGKLVNETVSGFGELRTVFEWSLDIRSSALKNITTWGL